MISYTRGVRRIVGDRNGTPYEVAPSIIEYLMAVADDSGVIVNTPSNLSPGDEVVIKEGPLKGIAGILHREIKSSERVVILLKTISYQARLVIDPLLIA